VDRGQPLRAILRVDPKTWTPEFMIPFTAARWHGCAWDAAIPAARSGW
jgi:hypothetical protein